MIRKNKLAILWSFCGVFLLGALFSSILLPTQTWLSITLSVCFLINLVFLFWDYKKSLTNRTMGYGFNSLITIVLVISIVGVLNFLSDRYPYKVDLTKNKLHTLTNQTQKVVKALDNQVHATLFIQDLKKRKYMDLLDQYKALSPNLNIEYVDPRKYPTKVKQFKVRKDETLHLALDDRTSLVEEPTEAKITNALINLTQKEKPLLCWIVGHNEKNFESSEANGYSFVKQGLDQQAFEINSLNLLQEGRVPKNCGAIAIVGPTKSFFPKEIESIERYLRNGGRALFAFDLKIQGKEFSPEFHPLLKKWHIAPQRDIIIDPIAKMAGAPDPATPLIPIRSPSHAITQELGKKTHIIFPHTRSLKVLPKSPTSLNVQWLTKSSSQSWGETDFGELKQGKVQPNKGDKKGPLVTSVAIEGKLNSRVLKNSRIVVFGTSNFATNSYARYSGNYDLFLNSTSWLLEQENLISIRSKLEDSGKLHLAQSTANLVMWFAAILFPGAISICGITFWARRRKL
mgnify:CR=1 FL=1